MASFWYLYCWLWTYFTPCSSNSIVYFEQVNACWEAFIFTVCLMNHIFQTSVLLIRVAECIIELNWLCKHIKKVRSCQPAIFVLNWIKHSFSLWIPLSVSVKPTFNTWNIDNVRWRLTHYSTIVTRFRRTEWICSFSHLLL